MIATVDHARLKRTRLIRAIKAAERALGMDDDGHRQLVREIASADSLTRCNLGQLRAILDHLNRKTGGYKDKPRRPRPGTDDQLAKIEAQLTDMRLPWSYAQAILKRVSAEDGQPGVDRFEWATPQHLAKLIAALDYEQAKRHASESVTRALAERGLGPHDLPGLCAAAGIPWHAGWARKPAIAKRYLQMVLARPAREQPR